MTGRNITNGFATEGTDSIATPCDYSQENNAIRKNITIQAIAIEAIWTEPIFFFF